MSPLFMCSFDPKGLLNCLEFYNLKYFPYRKAVPTWPRLGREIEFDRGDDWHNLRMAMAEKNGRGNDNHETWLIEYQGEKICIMFSDWRVVIGSDVKIVDW